MKIKNRYTVEVFHTICTEYKVIAESEQEAKEMWPEIGKPTGYVSDCAASESGQVLVHYDGEVMQ